MGVIEDLLHGLGSIVNGLFGVVQAILNGLVQLVQSIIFAFITFFTSIFSVVIGLFTTVFGFVLSNIAVIILAGMAYFAYITFVAPPQGNKTRSNSSGSKIKRRR